MECRDTVDLLITGGTIIDGTGKRAFKGSIGIKDGRILRVGEETSFTGKKRINASGLVVAPGFIDIHTHGDWHILERPEALNYIHQGVTTIIGGNCGLLETRDKKKRDIVDIAAFLEEIKKRGTALNFGLLAGYGTVRQHVLGESSLDPMREDLTRIKRVLEESMEGGAFGLSLGLEYLPGRFAKKKELIEIGETIHQKKGFLAVHMRDEQARLINSVAEVLEIGLQSKVPIHISHMKACGQRVWGLGPTISSMIGMAVAIGGDVSGDLYPYLSSSTGLSQLFPTWAHKGGREELKKRRLDHDLASMMKRYARDQIEQRIGEDMTCIQFVSSKRWPHWIGKTLEEVLSLEKRELILQEGIDLLIEAYVQDDPSIIYHYLLEDDVRILLLNPYVMICSDGEICQWGEGMPHPRSYGSFPRLLRNYTREESLLSLEEAIEKMTDLPAKRLGLRDRGRIEEGYLADIVIFHPELIADRATFLEPHQYPVGVEYVLVHGEVVIERGCYKEVRPGEVLYRYMK